MDSSLTGVHPVGMLIAIPLSPLRDQDRNSVLEALVDRKPSSGGRGIARPDRRADFFDADRLRDQGVGTQGFDLGSSFRADVAGDNQHTFQSGWS